MECVLDIVRESSGLLCANLPVLLFITLVLIFPVSSITLSQVMTNGLLADQLSTHIQHHLAQAGLHPTSFNRLFYLQLSQTVITQAFSFPVIITLWLLAKTAIFYITGCSYHGREATVTGFLIEGPRVWSRLAVTYLCGSVMVLGLTGLVVVWPVVAAKVVGSLGSMYLEAALLAVYAVVLAHMLVVLNLGSVVSGVEERCCGGRALFKALVLLKRRRMQAALLLFLITATATAALECAFQYRVLGRNGPTILPPPSASLLEAPLLVFAYSFLCLFDTIMSFAFYHACQSAAETASHCHHHHEEEDDHFSIAVEMVEQQCRKIMYTTL